MYNEGFKAVIEGMAASECSMISELHFQCAGITGKGLQVLNMLSNTVLDLQVLDLANNELGNEAL